MTQQHPITPPPELMEEWLGLWPQDSLVAAAQWGADQELEACRMEIIDGAGLFYIDETSDRVCLAEDIWTARRPKPPGFKEQAQAELKRLIALIPTEGAIAMAEPIRRALEQLPDHK
jgi:hypothetical protein